MLILTLPVNTQLKSLQLPVTTQIKTLHCNHLTILLPTHTNLLRVVSSFPWDFVVARPISNIHPPDNAVITELMSTPSTEHEFDDSYITFMYVFLSLPNQVNYYH
jgi:hypothetical protein